MSFRIDPSQLGDVIPVANTGSNRHRGNSPSRTTPAAVGFVSLGFSLSSSSAAIAAGGDGADQQTRADG
jgi:hypothetical protein